MCNLCRTTKYFCNDYVYLPGYWCITVHSQFEFGTDHALQVHEENSRGSSPRRVLARIAANPEIAEAGGTRCRSTRESAVGCPCSRRVRPLRKVANRPEMPVLPLPPPVGAVQLRSGEPPPRGQSSTFSAVNGIMALL